MVENIKQLREKRIGGQRALGGVGKEGERWLDGRGVGEKNVNQDITVQSKTKVLGDGYLKRPLQENCMGGGGRGHDIRPSGKGTQALTRRAVGKSGKSLKGRSSSHLQYHFLRGGPEYGARRSRRDEL